MVKSTSRLGRQVAALIFTQTQAYIPMLDERREEMLQTLHFTLVKDVEGCSTQCEGAFRSRLPDKQSHPVGMRNP